MDTSFISVEAAMSLRRIRFPARWGSLALAALLTACGGGGGGSNGSLPQGGGASGIAIAFTTPASEEVLAADIGVAITARVTVNGTDAADGTSVRFSATPGSFSATGTTLNGVATVVLAGVTPGRQELNASASVSGQTATAARVVYLRATPAPLTLLVPAYFYPSSTGSHWDRMTASAQAFPAVSITAIMNPNNGIFTAADPNFVRSAGQFVAAGGKVLGYVHTRYGNGARTLADIKANIDAYLSLYGRGIISGIFLDEMSADAGRLPFYRELHEHIKAQDPHLQVVGNPGTVPAAGYAGVTDVLVTFEGNSAGFQAYDPRHTPWLYGHINAGESALVHNVATCAAMQDAVKLAASARYNTGPVYMTDLEFDPVTGTGNPWAALPAYWNALIQAVNAANQGARPPAC